MSFEMTCSALRPNTFMFLVIQLACVLSPDPMDDSHKLWLNSSPTPRERAEYLVGRSRDMQSPSPAAGTAPFTTRYAYMGRQRDWSPSYPRSFALTRP